MCVRLALEQSAYILRASFGHPSGILRDALANGGRELRRTCDTALPLLITNVETAPSATPDVSMSETIHQHLEKKELLPGEHLVDAGYVDGQGLVESKLQDVCTAVAIDLMRLADWFTETPRAATRCSRFAALVLT